jgi:NAD-dependent histone deacetylase SIR2
MPVLRRPTDIFLVPDFRSAQGLFKALKKEHNLKSSGKDLFDASSVYKDENSISSFHQMVRQLSNMTKSAQPTPFHHMLASLADEGRLLRLYTQNVDGIDTSMEPLKTNVPLNRKGPWPRTIQLHGGLQKMVCSKCHEMSDLVADLFDGPSPPTCHMCEAADNARTEYAGKRSHGIGRLRPRMVLYNEHNPDDEAIGRVVSADLRTRPDALIVVGTTLKIPGVRRIVKEMCGVVRSRRGGLTVWINTTAPPPGKDYDWDLVVQGPCDRVAAHAGPRPITLADNECEQTDAAAPCVLIPATPEKHVDMPDAPIPAAMPTPESSRSSSTHPPPPRIPTAGGKPAITLKLRFDKKKEKSKTKTAAAGAKPTRAPRKPGVKRSKKESGAAAMAAAAAAGSAKIAFGASKAAATGAAVELAVKAEARAKSPSSPSLPSSPSSPALPASPKAPMRPVSPADLNAMALVTTPLEREAKSGLAGFVKASSLSPVSEQRRGYAVAQLLN